MDQQIKERPVIKMTDVVSSQIAAIGHDPDTNTLAIKFPATSRQPDGSLYHYRNFTADDFAAFEAAESKGSHFKKFIRNETEKFPYERVQ